MFETAIAGSLPKPSWLAETEKLWPEWKSSGAELERAKADATLLWLKVQEDAGIDVVGDGEQSRQHFVHGFLAQVEGIDFEHKVKMGIRDNRYDAMVPQVVGPLAPGRPRPRERGAPGARAHRQAAQVHLAGPDDDRRHRRRPLLRRAARKGASRWRSRSPSCSTRRRSRSQADGVDIIQFDEPAFNVYMADAAEWGVAALERAAAGADVQDGGPHLLRLRHQGQRRLEGRRSATSGASTSRSSRRSRRAASTRSRSSAIHSHVPAELMRLLDGKDVMVGVIDVASDVIETPEEIAETIGRALQLRARRSACSPAPTAAWRRCGARSPRPSWRRWRQGAALAAGRATADERGRARSAPTTPPEQLATALARAAATPSSRRPASPASPAPRSPSSTRCGRPGTTCRPTRYLRDGGRYRRRRHVVLRRRRRRRRAGAAPRALAAGRIQRPARRPRALVRADRRRPSSPQPAWQRCCARSRACCVGAEGRAAVVRRGAPVPHRHHRRHRPADARGRAPRRRRLRRGACSSAAKASRAARRACSRPTARTACASR